MTCDYDNDHFNQRLKLQHPVKVVIVMVSGHGKIVSKSRVKMHNEEAVA